MADKAYTPLTKPNPEQIEEVIADIPSYEDAGVRYQTYSKTKIGQKEYKLNPQTTFSYSASTGALVGSAVHNTLQSPPQGKKLYITAIHWSASVAAQSTGSYLRIRDTNGVDNKLLFQVTILRSETATITFKPALIVNNYYDPNLTPSGVQIGVSAGGGGTINDLSYNVQGFVE